MELLKKMTSQIHTTHTSNLNVRAQYLYSIYQPLSDKLMKKDNYLDIGCGYGVNSEVFGEEFCSVYCSDFNVSNLVKCKEYMPGYEDIFFIAADAQSLPFDDGHFDMVTAFSLIEHVPDQEQMLQEALRVLKKGGELVMQFPNRYFFMELHTGIPFYWLVPGFLKPWVARRLGYSGLSEIKIPTPEEIKKIIKKIDPAINVKITGVVYPIEVVPPQFRTVYSILIRMGIFMVVPFGWIMICEK